MTLHSRGFAPLAAPGSRVLVLGTLPGQASLLHRQYYAQPRNAFWKIMGDLFGAAPELPYEERTRKLVDCGVAVWDVCAAAHRPGSLDASIRDPEPNAFAEFLESHPAVELICFNGAKAQSLYEKLVLPGLEGRSRTIRRALLPSTSPAHAALPYASKLSQWSIVAKECGMRNAGSNES